MKTTLFPIIAMLIIASSLGCLGSTKPQTTQSTITTENLPIEEYIIVNPCIGSAINLWSGITDNQGQPLTVVGKIPDCKSVKVQVLKRECSENGLEFDLIRYENTEGWATRRLLTCPKEKRVHGCDSAEDSICPYG